MLSRMRVRYFVKRAAELAICRSGIAAVARRRLAGATVVLAYHNVVPHGQSARGDASLHLPQTEFARQLDELRRTHDIVPLGDVLQAPAPRARPRAVITLDDATAGALTAGVDELVRRGLPATFFVAPAFVPGGSFWWDALVGLDQGTREHALSELRGDDPAVRSWAASRALRIDEVPAHQRCGTEAQLAEAAAAGMTFGAHGWSHRNLAAIPAAELAEELSRPLAWLAERVETAVPWLAYPYGRSSAPVEQAAAKAGYEGAVRIAGGWMRHPPGDTAERYRLPRLNVPAGVTLEGFRLRAAGLLA